MYFWSFNVNNHHFVICRPLHTVCIWNPKFSVAFHLGIQSYTKWLSRLWCQHKLV